MKKMNLHPDELRVESFATAREQAGLAHAAEGADARGNGTSIKINCIPCTEAVTCWCV
ncbi:MAG TPA: hypothetical protein VFJ82_03225 [Longimicrobium sp.]|nr:hypothetical protein [Longimicrobium sp.]